jgi:ATP-binding cassette subfamily C (CFTR/MRP) protein 1
MFNMDINKIILIYYIIYNYYHKIKTEKNKCPEDDANLFSIISFHWVTPLMRKGYLNPLVMTDLWNLNKKDQSATLSDSFEKAWEKQLKSDKPSLIKAISDAYGKPFYGAGIWKAANDILGFTQPVLLRYMIQFVMSYKTDNPQPYARGYVIALLMLFCSVTQTIVLHQYFHLCFRTGMHVGLYIYTKNEDNHILSFLFLN